MPRNSSSAYRYDLEQPRKRKEQEKPKLKVVAGTKSRVKSAITIHTVLVFAVFVAAICFMVYNQAQLTEVTGEINNLNRQMKVLHSENVRLQSALEPTESLRLLAQQATKELRMHRLDHYDITYVNIYEEDKVTIAKETEPAGMVEHVEAAISSIVLAPKKEAEKKENETEYKRLR